MKIKYRATVQYDTKTIRVPFGLEQLNILVSNMFDTCLKNKESNTIHIGRKYISLDYIGKKDKLSTYIDLGNCYMRSDRTLQQLLSIIKDDPYIKINFK